MWGIFVAFGPQLLGRYVASWRLGLHPRLLPRVGTFWQRARVAIAGPVTSLFLCMATVLVLHLVYGAPSYTGRGVVNAVKPGSPAEQAGMQAGDVIWSLDGLPVPDDQIARAIDDTGGRAFTLEVERGLARRTLSLKAVRDGERFRIGIRIDEYRPWQPLPLGRALVRAGRAPFDQAAWLLHSFARIVVGKEKAELVGPVAIIQYAEATPRPARVLMWAASIADTEAALLGLPIALLLLLAARPRTKPEP